MHDHKLLYFLLALVATFMVQSGMAADEEVKKEAAKAQEPVLTALIKTNQGDIRVVLYPKEAPVTVKNFLRYAEKKLYDDTLIHRVVSNFIIQGGGLNTDLSRRETFPPIVNEADNNLSNVRGTIAMARTAEKDSATNQFYINLVDNSNGLDPQPQKPGYTVFGKVIQGMEIADAIAKLPTQFYQGMYASPKNPVIIEAVKIERFSPDMFSAEQKEILTTRNILKKLDIRSTSPLDPYTRQYTLADEKTWRDRLKIKFYTALKPFFPDYLPKYQDILYGSEE